MSPRMAMFLTGSPTIIPTISPTIAAIKRSIGLFPEFNLEYYFAQITP